MKKVFTSEEGESAAKKAKNIFFIDLEPLKNLRNLANFYFSRV